VDQLGVPFIEWSRVLRGQRAHSAGKLDRWRILVMAAVYWVWAAGVVRSVPLGREMDIAAG
jgi:hypothetical protein